MRQKIDIAHYHNVLSRKHQIIRLLWGIAWPMATWFLPRSMGMPWKRMWLRLFGARIAKTANVYASAKIYYPANLEMKEYSCLASQVDCYNVAPVIIGEQSTVSQGAYLCTAYLPTPPLPRTPSARGGEGKNEITPKMIGLTPYPPLCRPSRAWHRLHTINNQQSLINQ